MASTSSMLELTLPADAAAAAEARQRVCQAVDGDLDEAHTSTLRLLISELVTNAVRHGCASGPVRVRATWNSEVRVEVTDRGRGFQLVPRRGPLDDPGGFGLFLVGRLADCWGVETDAATTVWFVLRPD